MSDNVLSSKQFVDYGRIPGLNTPQSAAVQRFQNTTSVSVGGEEIVKISKGQRSKIRAAETAEDVANWGDIEEPGIKADQVQRAAHRYGLVGPHRRLGEVVLQAYGEGDW